MSSLIWECNVYDRHIAAYELELGMNMRESRLGERIRARELSYEFIVEIAESTLPFRNIHNLIGNLLNYHEWKGKNCNFKSICVKIMNACEKAMDLSKAPAGAGTMFGIKSDEPLADEDICVEEICISEPQDCDFEGRGIKRYPHTYECILYPHMYEVLKQGDTRKDQKAWEHRVRLDGSPRIMEKRVEDARKGHPRTFYEPYKSKPRVEDAPKELPF